VKLPENANVLLISVDSLRADMPWSGYPRDIAPNLTALEKKSVSFTHSYAVSSYTSMSLGGLLSGRYPSELKRDGFFFGTYPKENLFFPELLQAAKVKTVSAHAHGYFKDAGFQQGFDSWELVPNLKWNNTTDENVTGEQHEKLAEKLLTSATPEGDATSRFFAWFHFLDPHDMYMAHDADGIPPFGKKPRDKYDAEVLYTDQKLGKLLDFVSRAPWKDRTVIIVTADHGEAFGEHNQFVHGFELWENLVRVPLFFYVPGVAPKRLDTEVSAIDIAPTILEMMGVPKDPAMEGRSLLPSILAGTEPEARDVIVDLPDTSDNERRRGLVFGGKKLIAFGADTAMREFDLGTDPGEEHPQTSGDDFAAMVKRYKTASANIKDVAPYACQKNCLNRAYLNQGTK
jgi:arylsulfatase A-like enzyme